MGQAQMVNRESSGDTRQTDDEYVFSNSVPDDPRNRISCRIEKKLDGLIADVRAGRRAGSVLSMADDDEDDSEEQWHLWKGELIEE